MHNWLQRLAVGYTAVHNYQVQEAEQHKHSYKVKTMECAAKYANHLIKPSYTFVHEVKHNSVHTVSHT